MENTLQLILSELQKLRKELHELRQLLFPDQQFVEAMLRRRGFLVVKYTPTEHLVLPPDCSKDTEDEFYRLMKKYSFRIFLRDLITYSQNPRPELLTRYCSEHAAQQYLSTLLHHNILRQDSPPGYTFTSGAVPFFGDTLEWFVAHVMKKEFDSPASRGIRLKNSDAGGDYDVIASVEGRFVYIEVKSSPPKHIDIPEVSAFVDRVQNLRPDFAIFLEDTHLRMKDKLAVMFEEEMQRRYGESARQEYPVRRLHNEIFTINNVIFISNTKPDIVSNIGICLKHFFARGLEGLMIDD
jgi:hypothetical protein